MAPILTKTSCEAAATSLGFTDTSAYEHFTEDYPHGCQYLQGSDWLGWHPTEGNPYEDVPCGTNNYSCICSSKIPEL